mmetsp:Transcript_169/g.334  ORF Transcript_169/g.334 Transcript_169/m.334 type:complete len:83 (+) Transcript_169:205-453(+)
MVEAALKEGGEGRSFRMVSSVLHIFGEKSNALQIIVCVCFFSRERKKANSERRYDWIGISWADGPKSAQKKEQGQPPRRTMR